MNPQPKLTMTWSGWGVLGAVKPAVGHYLRTEGGRTAYEICAMRFVNQREPEAGTVKFVATCRRLVPDEVPEGATVHYFRWNHRAPRPARRLGTPH